jgi:hypothetical protein
MVVIFSFVTFVIFHLCVALSGQQDRHAKLVRELALMDERLRRMEARGNVGPSERHPTGYHEASSTGGGKDHSV